MSPAQSPRPASTGCDLLVVGSEAAGPAAAVTAAWHGAQQPEQIDATFAPEQTLGARLGEDRVHRRRKRPGNVAELQVCRRDGEIAASSSRPLRERLKWNGPISTPPLSRPALSTMRAACFKSFASVRGMNSRHAPRP